MQRSRPLRRLVPAVLVVLALTLAPPSAAAAQGADDPDRFRIGLTFGGISFVGLSVEYMRGDRSVDVTLGTWALRDMSLSVVGKQYLGPGGLRPYFGAGLWAVVAFPDEGTGAVLAARAPVGVDWRVQGRNFLGGAMNINRGLWVHRTDPRDETPLNRRLVPLPGFYYRWRP